MGYFENEFKKHTISNNVNEYYNNLDKPKIMLCDFDNVITFSDLFVCNMLYKNKDKFGKYLKLDHPFTLSEIYNRDKYYLNDWLKRDDIDEIPKDIIHDLSSFYSHPDAYNEHIVKFTRFSLILSRKIVKSKKCKSIYILTKNVNSMQDKLKQELLVKFFDREDLHKIEYASVKGNKKSETVKDLGIEWDSFADDYLENIYDLIRCNGFGKEYLIPEYGFNKPDEKASTIFYASNAQIYYMKEEYND